MNEAIPRSVLTDAVQTALDGRRIIAAVFCTFRFEPGFFEQEVLPVLFDRTLHHDSKVRLVQLEDALRPLSGKVAVYYDPRALVESDRGPAVLDVRRIPVRPGTGYFHPKNLFVLVEDSATKERELVVVTASANLTQAGWWENVECAHVDRITAGARSRLRDGMLALLDNVRRLSSSFEQHGPLDEIRRFVTALGMVKHRSAEGVLHPHFLANGRRNARTLAAFLEETAGREIRGMNLEIISPYLDDADASAPVAELIERFRPRQWRILLPEERDAARCRESLFDWVEELGGQWGRLPGELTSGGDQQAKQRTVHAKTYRFFDTDREFIFVGSFNLTRPAHDAAGNVESGVLIEGPLGRKRRQFWLRRVTERPAFVHATGEAEVEDYDAIPFAVRYDWSTGIAEVLWTGRGASTHLTAEDHGVPVFEVTDLEPGDWWQLPAEHADELSRRLRHSSMLTVRDGDRQGIVLVLETGMAHRPSLLLDLSPADILRFWSLLSIEQRDAYLAEHAERLMDAGEAAHLGLYPEVRSGTTESIFDRFAGMFHGFASLARSIVEDLRDGRTEEARFRMFGAKYDSLPVLIEQVARDTTGDLVDRYLMTLCGRQIADRVRRDWPDFWAGERSGTARLERALAAQADIRAQIIERNGTDMSQFLDWYEAQYLREVAEAHT